MGSREIVVRERGEINPTFGTRAFGESSSLKRLGKAGLTLARSSLQNLL